MKFITEGDLRDLFNKKPFTTYDLGLEEKLTPGARQFLLDRKIKIPVHNSNHKNENFNTSVTHAVEIRDGSNWRDLKLQSKLKSIGALFLLTGEELLCRDVYLAQKIVELNKQFSFIKNAIKHKSTLENFSCTPCTNINEENFSHHLKDCFEITEFHMQLDKGREILILHRLRCALQEIEPLVLELLVGSRDENRRYEELVCKVNQIINCLSQLICSLMGGETCLAKG